MAYNGTGGDWNVDYSTTGKHNAYGSSMSEFCANCHNQFLNTGNTSASGTLNTNTLHKHPAGNNPGGMDAVFGNYNDYAGTGSYDTSGSNHYWPLVPFEEGSVHGAPTATDTTSNLKADVNSSQVMCLTCHRAHASAFDHDTRWDTYVTFMSDSSVLHSTLGATAQNSAYYNAGASTDPGMATLKNGGTGYQRQLCNKCHVQD
ncbi:MAG: hypothetical protein M0Z75_01035 [Nitrospiraceae bacterium]|nr:hypothetical protein [Nitrospiraceae bacterium]